nr:Chain C, H17N10-NP [H17N10 subtype]6J2I_F Chain F, H17N10-NP [H17N10 subtype]
DFEKEGYSL